MLSARTAAGRVSVARTAFETLEVYRLAEELADAVWKVVSKWPPLARDTVGKQLIRAADSIGANIAEGHGRGDGLDHKRFLRFARGSTNETKHWLRRAYRRSLLTGEQVHALRPTMDALAPKLNAYMRSIGVKSLSGTRRATINTQQSTVD